MGVRAVDEGTRCGVHDDRAHVVGKQVVQLAVGWPASFVRPVHLVRKAGHLAAVTDVPAPGARPPWLP